jgi:hypothetical protein
MRATLHLPKAANPWTHALVQTQVVPALEQAALRSSPAPGGTAFEFDIEGVTVELPLWQLGSLLASADRDQLCLTIPVAVYAAARAAGMTVGDLVHRHDPGSGAHRVWIPRGSSVAVPVPGLGALTISV